MPRQYILLQAMKLIYIAIIILSRLTENFALIQTQYKRIFLEGSEWSEFMSKTMEFKTKGMHNLIILISIDIFIKIHQFVRIKQA